MVDLNNGTIIISSLISLQQKLNAFIHELGHLILKTPNHDNEWLQVCKEISPIFIFDLNTGNVNIGNVAFNIGNVTGVTNLLTDYFMLQSYRKFAARILATEGQWEVLGDNKVRLFPTPRGTYPVVVQYIPTVNHWHSPEAREVTKRMMVAEAKIMLGNARSKFNGIPGPDGGQIGLNGDSLRTEGQEEKKQAQEDAILLGEPLPIVLWSWLFILINLLSFMSNNSINMI